MRPVKIILTGSQRLYKVFIALNGLSSHCVRTCVYTVGHRDRRSSRSLDLCFSISFAIPLEG